MDSQLLIKLNEYLKRDFQNKLSRIDYNLTDALKYTIAYLLDLDDLQLRQFLLKAKIQFKKREYSNHCKGAIDSVMLAIEKGLIPKDIKVNISEAQIIQELLIAREDGIIDDEILKKEINDLISDNKDSISDEDYNKDVRELKKLKFNK